MPAYGVNNGVHPDHHAWWIHPQNGQFMIDGNDGGLNITKDGGKTWRFIGNLPVAQFYHISTDNEYPYNVYGGMQDNGSWRGPAYVWKAQGIRNSYWQEIAFGDGFDVVPDKDNSQFGYAMSQQGYVSRYDHKTGNNYTVRPTSPNDSLKLRFNWNAAIAQDPFNNNTVYFGSQFVHKSTNKGDTWKIISSDLSTNNPAKLKQSESGGLTMDATGAENHCTILVIEPSVLEKDMLWAATDDGKVHYTLNGGNSWTEVTKNIKGLPKGSWIPQIKASNKNKGEALLVANDYRRFNYEAFVYKTTNYGKTWTRLVDDLDVKSYALSIIEDPLNDKLLFLGTDDGLYISFNAGDKWQKWTAGFPTVSTKDLAIHEREDDLIIGTFGRAAWVLDDLKPLRAIASNPEILKKEISLFTSPIAYQAAFQQPTGSRFGADALYNATNKKRGAMITYYLKIGADSLNKATSISKDSLNSDKKGTKKIKDSLLFKFYKEKKLIRTLKYKRPKKAGFHRIYWAMDEKGPQYPSRKIKKKNTESGGTAVLAGTYNLIVSLGSYKDSTNITVKNDPRLPTDQGVLERYMLSKKLENYTQKATDAVTQLVESKKTTNEFLSILKKIDTVKYKEQIKNSKKTIKDIDSLIALFIGKEDKRQGITRNPEPTVMRRINSATYYVESRQNGITETETRLVTIAKNQLNRSLENSNAFFKNKWTVYRKEIEALQLSSFKEIKPVLLNKE